MFLCLNLIENNTLNLHLSRYLLGVGLAMMYIVKCPENAFSQGISVLCVKLSFKSFFLSVKQIRLQSHLQIFYFCLYILQLFYFKKNLPMESVGITVEFECGTKNQKFVLHSHFSFVSSWTLDLLSGLPFICPRKREDLIQS